MAVPLGIQGVRRHAGQCDLRIVQRGEVGILQLRHEALRNRRFESHADQELVLFAQEPGLVSLGRLMVSSKRQLRPWRPQYPVRERYASRRRHVPHDAVRPSSAPPLQTAHSGTPRPAPLVQRYPQHTFAVGGLDKNEPRPAPRIELNRTETNFDDVGTQLALSMVGLKRYHKERQPTLPMPPVTRTPIIRLS